MKREIEFASHPGNLCLMRDFVREFLDPIKLSVMDKDLIVLGLDEACTNVIRHAYGHEPDKPMHLVCEDHGDHVLFRLRDFGVPCEAEKLKGRALEDVRPGGLGIHLIQRAFSKVVYEQKSEGTELILRKELGD
jgi:anti-sigma regulatory factor (Ser/Thr protein kinase)